MAANKNQLADNQKKAGSYQINLLTAQCRLQLTV